MFELEVEQQSAKTLEATSAMDMYARNWAKYVHPSGPNPCKSLKTLQTLQKFNPRALIETNALRRALHAYMLCPHSRGSAQRASALP
eukprot:1045867-Prorocentrum_minimum.AAC.2